MGAKVWESPSAFLLSSQAVGGFHVKRSPSYLILLSWCFTSTEARWPVRDGDRVGRGRQSEGSTAETARKRPERQWTAARTIEVLRRCPLAIAQRLVHCAIAVSTAVLGQSHKDNVRCTAVDYLIMARDIQYPVWSQPHASAFAPEETKQQKQRPAKQRQQQQQQQQNQTNKQTDY